jgi:hypothetical protein
MLDNDGSRVMLNVGDSSYIGNSRINNDLDDTHRLSEPWKHFSSSNFVQEEDVADDNTSTKYSDLTHSTNLYDTSTKLQDNKEKHLPNDFEDDYSDVSSEHYSLSPTDTILETTEFDYQYFYLFGFLLLVLSIGFLYWENCVLDVPKNQELNLTVAYVLEKKNI